MYQNPYMYGANPYQNLAQQQQIQYYQNQLQALEQQAQGQQMAQNPQMGINGKYIQNLEEITVSDVPMNGAYSVFPKRDMSEIYVKAWDGNGNIQTVVYRPVPVDSQENTSVGIPDFVTELQEFKQEIMRRFDALEGKEVEKE